ncbi:MAG: DUF4003 family protein [Solibacillus sp.]|jgi:hypothetical protein|uniref:DUF4003 family protein n=1 Tax=unclassified Solibacillus TaxID=2637870 RepID=UPI0030FB532B
MNDPLQLFFDNLEKINLYFGSDANSFGKDLAVKLTVRNVPFYYEDYEKVQYQIKTHTKWYYLARSNSSINQAYYVHFAKTPEKVSDAIHMYKVLTQKFNRGEQSYLSALYLKSNEDMAKLITLMDALKKQPSLKYGFPSTLVCSILANRPEDPTTLADSYERYYEALLSIGFKRSNEAKSTALLLTVGTGTFCKQTFATLKEIAAFIKQAEALIRVSHYKTIGLLALARFEVQQFPALFDMHEEICRQLKIKPSQANTLLLTTQIYTSNETIGNLYANKIEFSDFAHMLLNDSFDSDSSHDGGATSGSD